MKVIFFLEMMVAVFLMGNAAGAQELLVPYNNFEDKTLKPEKWSGGQQTDSGMVTHEMNRLNPHFGSLRFRQASDLPDLSGLAWLGDCFLAVHDAKIDGESGNLRVSLLYLPTD